MKTKNEYIDFVKAQNNYTNVYTTVYDFEKFSDSAKIESSVLINRIFLDFDAHDGESLEKAFRDLKVIMSKVLEEDLIHTVFFSGRGFHLFIEGEPTYDIRNIQAYFKELKEFLVAKVGEDITLDDRVGQISRLRRVPNTLNLSASLYCIPLEKEDFDNDLGRILELAKQPRYIPFKQSGNVLATFPILPPIEEVLGEVSVPVHNGSLPVLPCLYSANATENPAHISRAYLVSWYRDLLSQCSKVVDMGTKNEILRRVVDEIEVTFANHEEMWLDWDKATTTKHAKFTVFGNYSTPSCQKLISDGYCVGRCWRYHGVNN